MKLRIITLIITLCVAANICFAGHSVAHTHIGVNPTWRPDWSDPGNAGLATDSDLTDDNKLWFFSVPPANPVSATPGWPNWEQANGDVFLQLTPVIDSGNLITKPGDPTKQLWVCDFQYSQSGGYGDPAGYEHINGWHSAFGPQGKWNLDSVDQSTVPDWDIHLRLEGLSIASDDFVLLTEGDALVPLTGVGDTYQLGKEWMGDENAWGIHEHMHFHFWLTPDVGQEISVTFSAYDAGGIYQASDNFEMTFVTVPEPGSLMLLSLGVIPLLRKKKNGTQK